MMDKFNLAVTFLTFVNVISIPQIVEPSILVLIIWLANACVMTYAAGGIAEK